MTIAPVRRSVRTKAPPARAFDIFTSQIGRWWPKGRTPAANPHVDLVIEPWVGGRWFERDADGAETPWGKVLVWDPPGRLVLAWQLNAQHRYEASLITEVDILFLPADGGGTEVTLEHRNLERFRSGADAWVARITEGWTEMAEIFAAFANRPDDTT